MAARGADNGCTFCGVVAGRVTAHVVHEDERSVAFLDRSPVFHGHTLLVPRVHVRTLPELPRDQVDSFFETAQRLDRAVETAMDADGSLVLVNNVVSQSVPHLHLHVIPRQRGDGLRFWLGPRHKYADEAAAEQTARRIRAAMSGGAVPGESAGR